MCGIFLLNKSFEINWSKIINSNYKELWKAYSNSLLIKEKNFNLGKNRGPDNSYFEDLGKYYIGFHRLSINGLNDKSNQPFIKDDIFVICNGEIYNFKEIYNMINIKPDTDSDCEIIIDLYIAGYTIDQICKLLDGVFAFIIYNKKTNDIFIGRDPFGIRPLFYIFDENNGSFGFASELKQLSSFGIVKQFPPGHCLEISKKSGQNRANSLSRIKKYFSLNLTQIKNNSYKDLIKYSLINSVQKRLLSDRPIACLLSGGLDSSLICSIVSKLMPNNKLNTFSIGLQGSTDLKYAKIVSEYLNTNHTEIIMSENDFFESIPEVIKNIESYDTTTVRASVGNYLISKYISQNTDYKVIFNGDGSDELTGGYLYFHNSPNIIYSHFECIRLLENIHYFDVLRSDRSISSCGLEPRTPFLDKSFVNLYLSIPLDIRFQPGQIEKKLLRDSFEGFLPNEILYRRKEAFSDGVSDENNSWYKIISSKLNEKNLNLTILKSYNYLEPKTLEQKYYRDLFDKYYPNQYKNIPYFWMPMWSNTDDPSARTIKF